MKLTESSKKKLRGTGHLLSHNDEEGLHMWIIDEVVRYFLETSTMPGYMGTVQMREVIKQAKDKFTEAKNCK